jgi:signal peptidase
MDMTLSRAPSTGTAAYENGEDASGSEAASACPRPTRAARIRDGVLGAFAIVGALSVAWVAISWLLSLSVFVLETESSAPSMPPGSVAVAHRVPADQLDVGDVVVLPEPGTLAGAARPIVALEDASASPGTRMLALDHGEDGDSDALRYSASEADVLLATAPHVGRIVSWFLLPGVTACVVIVGAIAVVWGIWPSIGRRPDAASRRTGSSRTMI